MASAPSTPGGESNILKELMGETPPDLKKGSSEAPVVGEEKYEHGIVGAVPGAMDMSQLGAEPLRPLCDSGEEESLPSLSPSPPKKVHVFIAQVMHHLSSKCRKAVGLYRCRAVRR